MINKALILFQAPEPVQWVRFKEEWPAEAYAHSAASTYKGEVELLHGMNEIIDRIPHRDDVEDYWTIYPDLRPKGGTFDCDDRTLTLRFMLHMQVGSTEGLFPMLCWLGDIAHMALLIRTPKGEDDLVADWGAVYSWQNKEVKPLSAFTGIGPTGWQLVLR